MQIYRRRRYWQRKKLLGVRYRVNLRIIRPRNAGALAILVADQKARGAKSKSPQSGRPNTAEIMST